MGKDKKVLISGITGQDGSYLADLLVNNNYAIIGLTRNPHLQFTKNIAHLEGKIKLVYSPYNFHSIKEIVQSVRPDMIFNLTGQSYVIKSWNMIEETIQGCGTIPAYFLEAIVQVDRRIRFFQASSSEIFTPDEGEHLTENSQILPKTPYGCAKALAHNMTISYRNNYGIFAVNGILFNHESIRRKDTFLSKKIINEAIRIKQGLSNRLVLGNLHVKRDWGYAPDYVQAMHRMMHMDAPEDLIISTGKVHSVKDMAELVFSLLGLNFKNYVVQNKSLMRPFEPPVTCGQNGRAKKVLHWEPTVSFETMLSIMVNESLKNNIVKLAS